MVIKRESDVLPYGLREHHVVLDALHILGSVSALMPDVGRLTFMAARRGRTGIVPFGRRYSSALARRSTAAFAFSETGFGLDQGMDCDLRSSRDELLPVQEKRNLTSGRIMM